MAWEVRPQRLFDALELRVLKLAFSTFDDFVGFRNDYPGGPVLDLLPSNCLSVCMSLHLSGLIYVCLTVRPNIPH